MRPLRGCLLSVFSVFLAVPCLPACGPWFPDTVLDQPGAPFRAPITSFKSEIRQIPPPSAPPALLPPGSIPPVDPSSPIHDGGFFHEIEELQTILRDLPAARRQTIIDDYTAHRQDTSLRSTDSPWPVELPLDIRLYLEGSALYRSDDRPAAIAKWKELLSLPPDQRRHRSTWAAWMIARALREQKDFADALPYYQLCSRLSAEGYHDPLHLGITAIGWEARCELELGHFRRAAELYYHQALAGDPGAWDSLAGILPGFDRADIDTLASDPFLRDLVTARLLTQTFDWYTIPGSSPGQNPDVTRWLAALEKAGINDLASASRFAELAYSAGDFPAARRWLSRSPSGDPRALWIRGKLALMDGHTAEAERLLSLAAAASPLDFGQGRPIYLDSSLSYIEPAELTAFRSSQLYGDLGAASLALNHFSQSLAAFQKGAFGEDSAYLAERVLTPAELTLYTDRFFPKPRPSATSDSDAAPLASSSRYLLARRLARLGYYAEARSYYPPKILPLFDRYVALRTKATSPLAPFTTSRAERAADLWEAAQIERSVGMELFGTEHFPDNFASDGILPASRYLFARLGIRGTTRDAEKRYYSDSSSSPITPAPTAEERLRVARSLMRYENRYHYIYTAADLAWQAAALMPDHSEDTARTLCIAGTWMKYLDPQAADRFYKAMIWRNWSTPLARDADRRRWFPPIEWSYDPYAAAGIPNPPTSW